MNEYKNFKATGFRRRMIFQSKVIKHTNNIIEHIMNIRQQLNSNLDTKIQNILDQYPSITSSWFLTPIFIIYFRTLLIIPCLIGLVYKQYILASFIVSLVDLTHYLSDIIVAKHGSSSDQHQQQKQKQQQHHQGEVRKGARRVSSRSDRTMEIPSLRSIHLSNSYNEFIDTICEKIFFIPCWIHFLSNIPQTTRQRENLVFFFTTQQYIIFWCLILIELLLGYYQIRTYYSSSFGLKAPENIVGRGWRKHNDSKNSVKVEEIAKAKQTRQMIGTALFILPSYFLKYLGLCLLCAAIPPAHELIKHQAPYAKKCVIYVQVDEGSSTIFTPEILRFWIRAKAIGSKLMVGIPNNGVNTTTTTTTTTTTNALIETVKCISYVDSVLTPVPSQQQHVDIAFLESHGIDYVACLEENEEEEKTTNSPQVVQFFPSNEVIEVRRCILIGKDGTAKLAQPRGGWGWWSKQERFGRE